MKRCLPQSHFVYTGHWQLSSLILYSDILKYGLRFKVSSFNSKARCHAVIPATKNFVMKFEIDYIWKCNKCAWLHCPLKCPTLVQDPLTFHVGGFCVETIRFLRFSGHPYWEGSPFNGTTGLFPSLAIAKCRRAVFPLPARVRSLSAMTCSVIPLFSTHFLENFLAKSI